MTTRTGIATLAALASLAALIAWWLASGAGRGAAPGNRTSDPAGSARSLEPSMPAERGGEPARRDATQPIASPNELRGGVAFLVPDYGPALRRPDARAEFELRDARGQPLEGAVLVGAELWRKVGEQWVAHDAQLDRQHSRVVCAGASDSGLPPGDYELEIRAGPYGALRVPFSLARGETSWRTLALPHWRRIVRLRLADSRGRPLARVTQAPAYVYDDVALDATPRTLVGTGSNAVAAPAAVNFATLLSRRTNLGWEAFYETDDGSFYVRVFAGLPAKLKLDLEADRYGQRGFAIESDFSGPEWDGYPLVIDPLRGLDERMAGWVDVNAGDAGQKSLLQAPINPVLGDGDPAQLADLLPGYVRIVIAVDAPIPVRLRTQAGSPRHVRRELVGNGRWSAGDVWYVDVMKVVEVEDLTVRYAFGDGFLLDVEAPLLELESAALAHPLFETQLHIEATPTTIEIVPPTPTLAAYARSVELSLDGGSAAGARSIELVPDANGSFQVRSALTEDVGRALFETARLALVFRGGDGEGFGLERELDEAERHALVQGGLRPRLDCDGLVLRVVDAEASGVPGAFVALVGESKLEMAEQMRRSFEPGAAEAPRSPGEAARQLAACEGWFKSENLARSDRDGYVLDDRIRLAAARHYALFFCWSSGAELQSQRVDFVATAGITDLGAVRLAAR